MQTRLATRFTLISLLAAYVVTWSAAQAKPGFPTAKELTIATAKCSASPDLKLNALESNSAIVAAASVLANQIVQSYAADPSKQPDLSSQWGKFHATLLTGLKSACPAQNIAGAKATTAASAKATTGQTNTQIGAPASSAGSTSATQKVGIPQLLGIAIENGAITNSVTGTTMTLSSTPYGFLTAFGKDDDTQSKYDTLHLLTKLGVSATFNVASTSNPLASATRKEVSQWQIKTTFRDTSTRSSKVNSLYAVTVGHSADLLVADMTDPLFTSVDNLLAPPETAVYNQAWSASTNSLKSLVTQAPAASDTDGSQKNAGIAQQLLKDLDNDPAYQAALASISDTSSLAALIQTYATDSAAYQAQQAIFAKQIADLTKGWNADISFSQQFPASSTAVTAMTNTTTTSTTPHLPDYLVGEFDITCNPKIVGTQKVACIPKTILTANFSGTFYTAPSAALNEKTFRGAQTSIQLQWNLGSGFIAPAAKTANDNSKTTLSVSGSYQRLQENRDQSGKKLDIVLGNVKLEIPISSGVSLPLSFSFANGTSQLKETYVRGNFGISFDLDKLSALLKANQ